MNEDRQAAYRELLQHAITAAVAGPARHDRYSRTAGIPWESLEGIRGALDEIGIDWRAMRARAGYAPVRETKR